MLLTAGIILLLAAMGGAYLLSLVLRNKETPKAIAVVHGLAAVTGVVLLIVYSVYYENLWAIIGIFLLAAVFGLYIFSRDILGKKIPKLVALTHGLLAIIGIITLFVVGFGNY